MHRCIRALSETPKSITMKCLRKSLKYSSQLTDECDVIIDINKKGLCGFKVLPIHCLKSGTNTDDANHRNGQGNSLDRNPSPFVTIGKNHEDQEDGRFPPLSQFVGLDCEFVGVRNDQAALGMCTAFFLDISKHQN